MVWLYITYRALVMPVLEPKLCRASTLQHSLPRALLSPLLVWSLDIVPCTLTMSEHGLLGLKRTEIV